MIARAAEGSVRDGLSILDQAIAHADAGGERRESRAGKVREMLGLADRSDAAPAVRRAAGGRRQALLDLVAQQFALGVEPVALLRGVMDLTHGVTLAQLAEGASQAVSAEDREAIEGWAKALSPGQLHRLWQLLIKGHDEVRSAPDPLASAQMALLRVMIYAGVGYQFFEDPNALEQLAWTAGASYYWKSLTFDVRYWDTNLSDDDCVFRSGFADGCDARVVGTISLDTTWSALFPRR